MPFALLLLTLSAPPRETAPWPQAPALTHAQSIRRLSQGEAAQQRRVRLTGIVTFANGETVGDFFMQDSTAGIYVMPTPLAKGLKPGDEIEVEGVTDPGAFAPCVSASRITRQAEKQPLPTPLPYNLAPEESRWLDGQFVQVWGVVESLRAEGPYTIIELYNASGRALIRIPNPALAERMPALTNAALTIRGVCMPMIDAKERVIKGDSTYLYTNTIPGIPLVATTPLTSTAIDHLRGFVASPHPGARRVAVTGVVIARTTDGVLFVQDSTGGVAVTLKDAADLPPNGRRVKVEGLLVIKGRRIALVQAKVEDLGDGVFPQMQSAEPAALAQGIHDATLVAVDGRVEEVSTFDAVTSVTLVDGPYRFDVLVPERTTIPPAGSRVLATGAPSRLHPTGSLANGFALWTRTADDLSLLELPATSWWTTNRLLAAFAIPLLFTLLTLTWVVTLRRRVRQQTADLRQQFHSRVDLEERLRTAQKLEAIGRLAGGIAHDFNNLLTVINGCGELLAHDLPAGPQRELARDIRSAGERAASLVSQLLLFSQRQNVRLHPVDLKGVVAEAERMIRRIIGETIRVECDLAPDTPTVRAEPTLLHQILLNLAVNAQDAMPVGGTLRIHTAPAETARGLVARLTVSDTGLGMDDATRARIFEPFFTTKEVGAGTGLGLATVYGIVQTLEGEIRCQSTLGKGTTFEIDLPAQKAVVATPTDGSAHRAVTAGRGTVLVCEDDDAVRELTGRILESAGYDVLHAETPTDATRIAQSHESDIDLLLTDLVMPDLNGRDLARMIRATRPNIRVMYMSGYTPEDLRRQGLESELDEVIGKPFTPAALTRGVNRVLQTTDTSDDTPINRV